jgi:uncharacterized cupredoxin-like copper-binding protein
MESRTLTGALVAAALSVALPAALSPASAAPGHADDGAHHLSAHGEPGDAAEASRTVNVVMHDNYYEPEDITVAAGETVLFKVRNEGAFVHEFNIGTSAMHAAHKDEMTMMVDHGVLLPDRIDEEAAQAMQAAMGHGAHDDPNSVLLEPGQSGEVVWTFANDADVALEFACNVPGHYDAGMVGELRLRQSGPSGS